MYWKRFACLLGVGLLVMGFSLPVWADDETDQVEIKVQATLDAVDCAATPPTITVLGLKIDISKASINSNTDNEDNKDNECNKDDEDSGNLTCADLVLMVGQVVEVKLASDSPDSTTGLLSATEVDIGGGECEDTVCDAVKIAAPLQDIDTTGLKVKVLGLVVDISTASLEGADDEDTEGENQLVDVSKLALGQFVEMEIDPTKLPDLVAKTLEVKNFTNQVDVEVIDEQGNQVDDGDVDDVQVDVQVTTKVKAPAKPHSVGVTAAPKRVKKILRFHTTSNGSVNLAGLPTGRAKIVVTRVNNGHTSSAKRTVNVSSNRTKYLRMRLKAVH
jgi:hypothetical protein